MPSGSSMSPPSPVVAVSSCSLGPMSSPIPLCHASYMPYLGLTVNVTRCRSPTTSGTTPSKSSSSPSLDTAPGESPSPSPHESRLLPTTMAPHLLSITSNTHPMQTLAKSAFLSLTILCPYLPLLVKLNLFLTPMHLSSCIGKM